METPKQILDLAGTRAVQMGLPYAGALTPREAAAQLGYAHALNVLEGFEGAKDPNGHRATVGGWKVAGLPWVQS